MTVLGKFLCYYTGYGKLFIYDSTNLFFFYYLQLPDPKENDQHFPKIGDNKEDKVKPVLALNPEKCNYYYY